MSLPVKLNTPVVRGADTKIESNQDAFRIREVADDFLDRFGQPSDESREGENLVALSELRILHQIDHFDRVPPVEVLVADLPQIARARTDFGVCPATYNRSS